MKKRYTYRLYPTADQQQLLARSFGCARVVFNDFVAERNRLYAAGLHQQVPFGDTEKLVTTVAKRADGARPYLAQVSSVILQQSVRDAQQGFRNFFNSATGRRKGPKVRPPRFKSRRQHRQRIRLTRHGFRLHHQTHQKNGKLYVAKIGHISIRMSRPLPAEPSSVTVTQYADGFYEASFVVEVEPRSAPKPKHQAAGIDLGITDLAIIATDTGEARKVANPRHLQRAQRKLAQLQRSLSRKQKGSTNRTTARKKVARQHRTVANARKDYHHKVARQLVDETQALAVEDLNITGMVKNRKLAKHITDVGWGQLMQLLHDKATEAGRTLITIDRWHPSSQLCSACGCQDGKKPLHIRQWACPCCHALHDRDINAARNIMIAAGLAEITNGCGGNIRPHPGVAAPTKQQPTEHLTLTRA
ncbi:transposase [Yaniella flava]